MRIVVALDGNALLKRGEPMTHAVQRADIHVAARALAHVVEADPFVITTDVDGVYLEWGKRAAIGSLADFEKIVAGEAGTNVYP
jgi:carbamate kinase